jgi:cold shock protein
MATGRVKWYDATKGFGFILPDEGGPDIYVNKSTVIWAGLDSLKDGQRVFYEVRVNERTGRSAATSLRMLETEGMAS